MKRRRRGERVSGKRKARSGFKARRKNIGKGSIRRKVRKSLSNPRLLSETKDTLSGKKKTDVDLIGLLGRGVENAQMRIRMMGSKGYEGEKK